MKRRHSEHRRGSWSAIQMLMAVLCFAMMSGCIDVGEAPGVNAPTDTSAPVVEMDSANGSVEGDTVVGTVDDATAPEDLPGAEDKEDAAESADVERTAPDASDAESPDTSTCELSGCSAGSQCLTFQLDLEDCECKPVLKPAFTPCDDGDSCTEEDYCRETGECVGTLAASVCDDGNPCTSDQCASNVGCVHTPVAADTPCEDDEPCTTGTLCTANGSCLPGPNYEGTCGLCDTAALDTCEADNGDNDPCNGTLQCVQGLCLTVPESVVVCEDTGSPCLINACVVSEGEASCELQNNDGQACTDLSACTESDTCVEGECVGAPSASAQCQCESDSDCDEVHNDDDLCNGSVRCIEGLCLFDPSTVVVCETLDLGDCTAWQCDALTGECGAQWNDNGILCEDDDDLCTLAGTCNNGACLDQEPVDCSGLGSACAPASCDETTGSCVSQVAPLGADCAADNPCLISAECDGDTCVPILETSCDDQNACTVDQCDPLLGCLNLDPESKPLCEGVGVCAGAEPSCVGGVYQCVDALVPGYSPVEYCNGLDDDCDGETDEDGCLADDIALCSVGTLQATFGEEMRACGVSGGLTWSEGMCPTGWHVCDYTTMLSHLPLDESPTFFDDYWITAAITRDDDGSYVALDTPGQACVEHSEGCGASFTMQAVTHALPYGSAVSYADTAWGCEAEQPTGSCEFTGAAGVMCCRKCDAAQACPDDGDPCTVEACDTALGACIETTLSPESACANQGVCAAGVPLLCEGGGALCDYEALAEYEASEVSCDGVDNDCDGLTDSDDPDLQPLESLCPLQAGVCQGAVRSVDLCVSGQWLDCSAEHYGEHYQAGVETLCDGLDNNCDGQVDEHVAYEGRKVGESCEGLGACGDGLVECASLSEAQCSTLPGGSDYAGSPEVCDDVDNDCNGIVDDALTKDAASCMDSGVCALAQPACVAGQWHCNYASIPSYEAESETLCDGQDNDCDGQTDEGEHIAWVGLEGGAPQLPELGDTCGNVPCDGHVICTQDLSGFRCSVESDAVELCDDIDNDCDGENNEGITLGEAALGEPCVGLGACAAETGIVQCNALTKDAVCSTMPQGQNDLSSHETCNGIDDDCDGEVDEGMAPDGAAIGDDCDGLGECGPGIWECDSYGQALCCTSLGGSEHPDNATEICDGLDNDCDGHTDEGLSASDSDCALTGVCTTANVGISCEPGGWVCDYSGVEGYALDEAGMECDGLDNDCDGLIDETYASQLGLPCDGEDDDKCENGTWICDPSGECMYCEGDTPQVEHCNGIDDDCDGLIDDDAVDCVLFCKDDDNDGVADAMSQSSTGDCSCLCAPTDPYLVAPPLDSVFDCDSSNSAIYPGAPELCNGVDDDCDDLIDAKDALDLITSDPTPCADGAQGVCEGLLTPANRCSGGQWTACEASDYEQALGASWEPGVETLCDGLDNNCDGQTDEAGELSAPLCPNQLGLCSGAITPQSLCNPGLDSHWDPCTPADYTAHHPDYEHGEETTCDYVDNDCDGQADEGFMYKGSPVGGPCDGEGECGVGVVVCGLDAQSAVCSTDWDGGFEECNGLDDDCDGLTDEALPFESSSCSGIGVCSPQTVVATCTESGIWHCDYSAVEDYEGSEELTCDDLDNDCDGQIDEGFTLEIDGDVLTKGDPCPESECGEEGSAVVTCNPEPDDDDILACSDDFDDFEICDGEDNDCDDEVDEDLKYEHPGNGKDGKLGDECDGIGNCGRGTVECGVGDIVTCSTNPNGSQSAAELDICDGQDNDCDGAVDEGFSYDGSPLNSPCAGLGVCSVGVVECNTEGGVTCSTLADGSEAQASDEVCDGLDNDCDGEIDEALGVEEAIVEAPGLCSTQGVCGPPNLIAYCEGGTWTCVQESPDYQPLSEAGRCDTLDNDCDGKVDEDFAGGDGEPGLGDSCDGADADQCASGSFVCDKHTKELSCQNDVNQSERCDTVGVDDDCDGLIDEAESVDCLTYYQDSDGDDWGQSDKTLCQCPLNLESPFTASLAGDCDDLNADIHPGADEDCSNVDMDCDGEAHAVDALGCTNFRYDMDNDGYGAGEIVCLCDASQTGFNMVAAEGAAEDCDDWNASISPGTQESCDTLDNDCDGETDEADAFGCTLYLSDNDNDGFGAGEPHCLCQAAPHHVTWNGQADTLDCCDTDSDVKPGQSTAFATQTECGGYDFDCDGVETKTYTETGKCTDNGLGGGCPPSPDPGWLSLPGGEPDDAIPACGSGAPFVTGCYIDFGGSTGDGVGAILCQTATTYQDQLCK